MKKPKRSAFVQKAQGEARKTPSVYLSALCASVVIFYHKDMEGTNDHGGQQEVIFGSFVQQTNNIEPFQ